MIPAYNEERTIAKVIILAKRHCDSIIVCDDGSTDATRGIAEGLGVIVITHERNQGKGSSMLSLFLFAMRERADFAVTLDADGQHDPNEIPLLLAEIQQADIVIGGRRQIPGYRGAGNKILKGNSKFDTESGFRAYRVSKLALILPTEAGMSADSEILRYAEALNMTIKQVEVSTIYDVPNPSKTHALWHFSDVILSKVNAFAYKHPLLLYFLPGLIVTLVGIYFAISDFYTLVTQGQGSILLINVGLILLQTGLIVWTATYISKRNSR